VEERKREFLPPVGYYYSKFKVIDKNLRAPSYGSRNRWEGSLSINSQAIKDS